KHNVIIYIINNSFLSFLNISTYNFKKEILLFLMSLCLFKHNFFFYVKDKVTSIFIRRFFKAMSETTREEILHSGEVFHLWSYLEDAKAYLVTLQVLINHTEDDDLKLLLEDLDRKSTRLNSSHVSISYAVFCL